MDTPQLNSIAKRLNQPLMEKVCAQQWAASEAVGRMAAALLKNRTSTPALGGKMPWQAPHGQLPDLHGLKHSGKMVWVHDRLLKRSAVRTQCLS